MDLKGGIILNKLKVIQVGAGRFGQSWLKNILNYPHADLVAVVDMLPENLNQVMISTGLNKHQLFTRIDDAFENVAADLVLIVTPPKTHKEIAVEALNRGFHIMLEKPLAHTYEEAIQLLEMSRINDRKICVSQNYRWRTPILTIKNLISSQNIGNISYIEYQFRKSIKFGGWRDEYEEILIQDMSIHHFDIMRFLLGKEPEEIIAQSFSPSWSWFKGNPVASVFIRFHDDIFVNYFGSWVSRGQETSWNGDIRIVGEKGAVELINDKVYLYPLTYTQGSKPVEITPVKTLYDDRTASLHNMVESIHKDIRPLTSIEDNIYSFELTCAAIESARQGKKVSMKTFSQVNTSSGP